MRVKIKKPENSIAASYYISNLKCNINENNLITLCWDWPDFVSGINCVFAFEVTDNSETLENYLSNGMGIRKIPRVSGVSEDYSHAEVMDSRQLQLKLFPAIINKYGETEIYDQPDGNVTPIFYRRTILNINVRYGMTVKNLLNGFRMVSFEFKDDSEKSKLADLPQDSLLYYKYDNKTNKPIAWYPIDSERLSGSDYRIILENGCGIKLCCRERYSGAVDVRSF